MQEVYPTWFAWIYVLATPEVAAGYACEITAKSAEETQVGKKIITIQCRFNI